MLQKFLPCQLVRRRVPSISLHAIQYHLGLIRLQEGIILGEVHNEEPRQYSKNYRDYS